MFHGTLFQMLLQGSKKKYKMNGSLHCNLGEVELSLYVSKMNPNFSSFGAGTVWQRDKFALNT